MSSFCTPKAADNVLAIASVRLRRTIACRKLLLSESNLISTTFVNIAKQHFNATLKMVNISCWFKDLDEIKDCPINLLLGTNVYLINIYSTYDKLSSILKHYGIIISAKTLFLVFKSHMY